jgi:CHASE1-domain containing sensor protein
MFSEPVRREAMEYAAARGFAFSGKVTLVQETDRNSSAGFLMYVGVYAGGVFPRTEAERKEKLTGFVYSPFRADDLFGGIKSFTARFARTIYLEEFLTDRERCGRVWKSMMAMWSRQNVCCIAQPTPFLRNPISRSRTN